MDIDEQEEERSAHRYSSDCSPPSSSDRGVPLGIALFAAPRRYPFHLRHDVPYHSCAAEPSIRASRHMATTRGLGELRPAGRRKVLLVTPISTPGVARTATVLLEFTQVVRLERTSPPIPRRSPEPERRSRLCSSVALPGRRSRSTRSKASRQVQQVSVRAGRFSQPR